MHPLLPELEFSQDQRFDPLLPELEFSQDQYFDWFDKGNISYPLNRYTLFHVFTLYSLHS